VIAGDAWCRRAVDFDVLFIVFHAATVLFSLPLASPVPCANLIKTPHKPVAFSIALSWLGLLMAMPFVTGG
jgi:hypothetical protein